jgi:hypothetical protein
MAKLSALLFLLSLFEYSNFALGNTVSLGPSITNFQFFHLKNDLEDPVFKKLHSMRLPQSFVRHENFRLKSTQHPPSEVIYGNSEIGFFSSKNFKVDKDSLLFTFIPPSYRKPIEFTAIYPERNGSKKMALGERKYGDPLGNDLKKFIDVKQTPSFPFVMINWQFGKIFPVVLNRLGEVVWIVDTPSPAEDGSSIAYDILENGDFLFLRVENTSLFQVSAFGETRAEMFFGDPRINLPSSHTVQYLKDTNEILFLSFESRVLPWWKEFISLFKGPMGWLRLMTLPRRTYRSGRLIQMSLNDYSYREIWNSYKTFSPDRDINLAVGFLTMADRFQDAKDENEYRALLDERTYSGWYGWPDHFANAEWTHENSAQFVKGKGYLISVRNLNEIILLDEAGHLKWRMGEGKTNHDYYFERSMEGPSFSMQHSAVFMRDGRILLYDNHTPYRGFTGIRHGNQLMILDPKTPGPILPEWTFLLPNPHSDVRGSTEELANGNVFAYTAGNPGLPGELWEVDPKTSTIVGNIELQMHALMRGIEAKPFYGFAGDKYLGSTYSFIGETPPTQKEAHDLLEFSY